MYIAVAFFFDKIGLLLKAQIIWMLKYEIAVICQYVMLNNPVRDSINTLKLIGRIGKYYVKSPGTDINEIKNIVTHNN